MRCHFNLVGGWPTHFEKYARQIIIGSFPPIFGLKIKNARNHHTVILSLWRRATFFTTLINVPPATWCSCSFYHFGDFLHRFRWRLAGPWCHICNPLGTVWRKKTIWGTNRKHNPWDWYWDWLLYIFAYILAVKKSTTNVLVRSHTQEIGNTLTKLVCYFASSYGGTCPPCLVISPHGLRHQQS